LLACPVAGKELTPGIELLLWLGARLRSLFLLLAVTLISLTLVLSGERFCEMLFLGIFIMS